MQDRFSDLGEVARKPKVDEDDVEMNTVKESEEDQADDEFMKEFFEVVSEIKSAMALIRRNLRSIEDSYNQSLVALNVEQGARNSEELEKLIESTNLAAADVRNKLKQMDAENKKLPTAAKGSAQYRIRTNMHGTLTRKFIDLMSEYQEMQTKYKNKYRERVERQYRIAKPDATQEEIDNALESGDTQIFANQILDTLTLDQ